MMLVNVLSETSGSSSESKLFSAFYETPHASACRLVSICTKLCSWKFVMSAPLTNDGAMTWLTTDLKQVMSLGEEALAKLRIMGWNHIQFYY